MNDLEYIGMMPNIVYGCSIHKHPSWEIVYYLEGSGTMKWGNSEESFKTGDILCLPPHINHQEISENGYRNIHFLVNKFYNIKPKLIHYKDNQHLDFQHLAHQMYRIFHTGPFNWQYICESLLNTMYQHLISWNHTNKNEICPAVEEVIAVLISNISNADFDTDSVLTGTDLCKDYFRRLFKKYTGKTPLQYITQKRIEFAMKLLQSNDKQSLNVAEIAQTVGFENPLYFSRVFKKITGLSPLRWLKSSKR